MENKHFICSHCSKEFQKYRRPNRLKKFKHIFCSIKCRGDFVHKNGAYWLDKDRNNIFCEFCEKSFTRKTSVVRFCSRICVAKYCLKNEFNNIGKSKEKNPYWKGGITPINTAIRMSKKFQDWRKSVFERDNYTCQECKNRSRKNNSVVLNAHHIKPFAHFPEFRFDLENGTTLCEKCHRLTDSYGNNIKKYATTN